MLLYKDEVDSDGNVSSSLVNGIHLKEQEKLLAKKDESQAFSHPVHFYSIEASK